MMDPAVSPYVRYQCQSYEEYLFLTKQLMVEEEQKTVISRTILNETEADLLEPLIYIILSIKAVF